MNAGAYDERVRSLINGRLRGMGKRLTTYCASVVVGGDIEELSKEFADDIDGNIEDGIRDVWAMSDAMRRDMQDEARMRKRKTARDAAITAAMLLALQSFLSRKERVMVGDLADAFARQVRSAMPLLSGEGVRERSRQLAEYIKNPSRININKVEQGDGDTPVLQPQPSLFSRMRKILTTDIATAYRTAEYHIWQKLPFVVGQEIRLGKKHPVPDICDDLQGIYPKDFKFTGWHPWCRCFAHPIFSWESDKVKDMPECFNKWMEKNEKRIEAARKKGTLPYFVRDNEEYVDTVRKNRMALLHTEVVGIAELSQREFNVLAGDIREVANKTEMFGKGYKIDFAEFSDGTLMQWKSGKLTISTVRHKLEDGSIFCPVENLQSAFKKLKAGKTLDFCEEYSIECLFHESIHARATRKTVIKAGTIDEKIAETCTQLYARDRYVKILKAYGVEAVNFERIKTDGLGYNQDCSKLRGFFTKDGELQVGELINIANETESGKRIMIKKLMRMGMEEEEEAENLMIKLIVG